MMRFLTGVLVLTIFLQENRSLQVTVTKCCPDGEIFSSGEKQCVQSPDKSIIGSTISVTNKTTSEGSVNPLKDLHLIEATLNFGDTGLPDCAGVPYETHILGTDSLLTESGKLIASKYENGFGDNEFCVDLDASNTNNKIAVMCDICKKTSNVCYNLCCPHGYHYEENLDTDLGVACVPGPKVNFSKEVDIWNADSKISDWRLRSDIVIVAPKEGDFAQDILSCPSDPRLQDYWFYPIGDDLEYRIQFNGQLKSTDVDMDVDEEMFYPGKEFCLGFLDAKLYKEKIEQELENYPENAAFYEDILITVTDSDFVLKFYGCGCGQDADGNSLCPDYSCQDLRENINSGGIIISIVFLLVTLFVHFVDDSLRRSQIVIGFMINLTISLILFTPAVENSLEQETTQCKVIAYLKLYFFLSFYCWLNTMCFNIWYKFYKLNPQSSNDGKKFLMRYLVYSQGIPLVITILVLVIDMVGQSHDGRTKQYLPNMGAYCFLANGIDGQGQSYFTHPIFIYFQSIMLIMQGANMFFLIYCVVVIRRGFNWKKENAEDREQKYKLAKRELKTITRLGVIMGVFWIGEFISTAIGIEYCPLGVCKSVVCYAQIILDIPNLLAGFLIFLVTVCKKKVYHGLRKKLGRCSAQDNIKDESRNTEMTPVVTSGGEK